MPKDTKFKPGNEHRFPKGKSPPGANVAPRSPDAIIMTTNGFRDEKGRFVPGSLVSGNATGAALVYEKRLAIQEAASPALVVEALLDIVNLARTTEYPWVKLAAWQEVLNRTVGKAPKELHLEKTETKTLNVNLLSSLSDEALARIESIMKEEQAKLGGN